MTKMILQTNIRFPNCEELLGFVKLKNGSFILFTKYLAFLFNKNLSFQKLNIKIDDDDENYNFNNIKSVKQLKNGKILICSNYLYIFTMKSKEINTEKIAMLNAENYEKILDVVELRDGTIIGISNKSLYKITIKDDKNEISQIYKIPKDWLVSWENEIDYNGYLDIYELKDNKLLIHSHSYCSSKKCRNRSTLIQSESKIFIINLSNFEVIYFEKFHNIANIIVLKDYIAINHSNSIFIYDINNYKILQKISSEITYIDKYNDNTLISLNDYVIILYDISDINNIKFCKLENDSKNILYSRSKTSLHKLNERCILTISRDMKIFKIVDQFNYQLLLLCDNTNNNNDKKKNRLRRIIKGK